MLDVTDIPEAEVGMTVTIFGKDVYYGGDMLHNFQSNTNVDIPGAINYIQLGTGATHTIDDFYNYFYKDRDE